jgi:peptidoglycan/xylan/chitin deacetylase (PgdA/CDA1 family)
MESLKRASARTGAAHRWLARGCAGALAVALLSNQGWADSDFHKKQISVHSVWVNRPDIPDVTCSMEDDHEDHSSSNAATPAGPSSQAAPTNQAGLSGMTIVSLTFDDTTVDQYQVRPILAAHHMPATFYVNSGRIGQSGYMSLAQLQDLHADGHEIAGHTISHPNLTTLSTTDQIHQICDDRNALLQLGFDVTSFAYPFGATNASIEQIVAQCGYNSGRGVGGLVVPGSCSGCPYANTVPPDDSYKVRTPDSIKSDTSLATIEGHVTQAEQHGGGWVPLVMHHICNGCNTYSVSAATLTSFLDWLEPRSANGTVVMTVDDVMGGALKPPSTTPPPPPPPTLQNPSLEASSASDGTPDCWMRTGYGTNSATWTRTTDAHSGSWAQKVSVTSLTSGERKLVSGQDSGACALQVTAGTVYKVSAWYKTDAQIQFAAYYRNSSGGWVWWSQSQILPTSSSWKQGTWTMPAVPSGVTAISFGLAIRSTGSLTMDDFTFSQ